MSIGQRGCDETELSRAASEVEDASAGRGNQKFCRLGCDAHRGPLQGRELSDAVRIDLVEFFVLDRGGLFLPANLLLIRLRLHRLMSGKK